MNNSNLRRRRIALTIYLSLALCVSPSRSDVPVSGRLDPDCGLMSLSLLLSLEGRPTELDVLESRLPAPTSEGFSMIDLRTAAKASGLDLAAYSLGPGEQPPDRAFLAYVKVGEHGHYQVVRKCGHTGKMVQVIDPSKGVEVMDASELFGSPSWSGLILTPRSMIWTYRSPAIWAPIIAVGLSWWIVRLRHRRGRALGVT